MKRTLALILALCMVFALCACGSSASQQTAAPAATDAATPAVTTPEAPAEDAELATTLNVALSGEPTNLDLMTNTADVAGTVARSSVFEQLVAIDGEGNVVKELAEEIEISEDSTVYTYKLRQGVHFHNGEEMTAADAAASLNRWLENASAVQGIVGENKFEAVDTYTLQITLATASAYLNEMIAGLSQFSAIMPASVLEKIDETGVLNEYVGTGPYMVSEWKPDQYIKLVRFDGYTPYGTEGETSGATGYKVASYEDVYFYFPGDNATIANGMLTGEYDVTSALEPDDYDQFTGNEDYTIFSEQAEAAMLIFNKAEGWGANQTFRQALQALVNADDVLYAAVGNENYYSLYSSYSFSNQPTWYTENGSEYYNQGNPERALELLADAGWNLESDTFRILVASDSPDFLTMAQVIEEECRDAGINARVDSYEWSTFADIRNNRPSEYDAFITSFSPKVLPSMNLFLSATWAGKCTDERIQSDLAAISGSTDAAAAQQIWFALQQYMYEEYVPVVKFGTTTTLAICDAGMYGASLREGGVVWVNSVLAK